jgi:ABC-2 type transport system permease protein
MKTMTWLLRREFWEHKGAFFWAPVVVGLAMIVFMGGGLLYGLATEQVGGVVTINGHEVSRARLTGAAMPEAMRAQIAGTAASSYLASAAPLFAVLPVVVFFYCLAALYDDRRDRSILFWKSLPVSDRMTVVSKAATALVVAPVITIAVSTATALVLLSLGMIAAAASGLNLIAPLLASPRLYLAPLHLLALLPVYVLWALPTVGWLLMVSSWARSKVFLWAVGAPLIALLILRWFNSLLSTYADSVIDIAWISDNVLMRALAGLIPGIWLLDSESSVALASGAIHGVDLSGVLARSWMTLAQPGVWGGAAAGIAMLFAAVRLRRWREEG